MLSAMLRAGYAPGFAAAVTAAAGSTDILIPPSVAFIVYSVLVPSATVPALFVGGIIPGVLACVMLIIPALFLSLHHNFGSSESGEAKPKFWESFKDAAWALAAPVLILGGLRTGWFTPTEAAVMAVVFGLFVGFVVYRSLTLRALFELLVESAETSAVILVVVGLASVFAWACSTLGIVDPISRGLVALGGGELARRHLHPDGVPRHRRHVPRRHLHLPYLLPALRAGGPDASTGTWCGSGC